ncbi:MAG: RnfH family protein [Gammaproteobacteria bacterium]|nr:MAG: RnfH family protein [Gammaproteobacteria bacterium]
MAVQNTIEVEVVYALAERQELLAITMPAGATVAEAIELSGIAGKFPEQDLSACTLGLWGRLTDSDHLLQDGDRIEIYRPLLIEPRETRRQLAAEGKSMGGSKDNAGQG